MNTTYPILIFSGLVDTRDKPQFLLHIDNLTKYGKPILNYCLRIHKNNLERWIQINAVSFSLLGKNALQIVCVDVTETKNAQVELQYTLDKFKSVIDNSTEGIIITNEIGSIVEWNPAMDKLFGFSHNQAIGIFVWDLYEKLKSLKILYDFDPESYKHEFMLLLKTGNVSWLMQKITQKLMLPYGKIAFIEQVSYPIKTEKGIIIATMFHDVTDEKQIEEELLLQQKALNALINSGEDAIGLFSIDFKIEAINHKASLLFADTNDVQKLIGRNFFEFIKATIKNFIVI